MATSLERPSRWPLTSGINVLIFDHLFFKDVIAISLTCWTWCNDLQYMQTKFLCWTCLSHVELLARRLHSSFLFKDKIYLFGGYPKNAAHLDTTVELPISATEGKDQIKWKLTPTKGKVTGRSGHTCVLVGNRVFITGGYSNQTGGKVSCEVNVLDLQSLQWKKLPVQGDLPQPRDHQSATLLPDGRRIVYFGGKAETGYCNDVHIFDTVSEKMD